MRLAVVLVPCIACVPRPADVPGNIESAESAGFGGFVDQITGALRILHQNKGPGRSVPLGAPQIVGPGAGRFTIFDDECEDMVMPVLGYCSTFVQFTPSSLEPVTAELRIDAAHDGPLVTRLVGAAVEPQVYPTTASFPFAFGATQFVLVDVNTDGKLDVASPAFVLLNASASAPSFLGQAQIETGSIGEYVATADINGDGKPDLVNAGMSANTVRVLLNTTASGSSTPSFDVTAVPALSGATTMQLADLDSDGKADILLATALGKFAVLLNQTGTGASTPTFAALAQPTDVAMTGFALGDVDGDDDLDLAVAGPVPSVLVNTSTPGAVAFGTTLPLPAPPFSPSMTPCFIDFNRDSRADVAYMVQNELWIARNEAAGSAPSFVSAGSLTMPYGAGSGPVGVNQLTTGDANGDGAADLVAMKADAKVAMIYNATPANETVAVFAVSQIDVDATSGSARLGQIRDGKLDLLVSSGPTGTLTVFAEP